MKELYSALAKAQQSARKVEKGSTNKFHKYDYASAEDVIIASRAALAENGLAFVLTTYEVGGNGESGMLRAVYLLVHESGGSMEVTSQTPWHVEKGRPADKAVACAKTYDLSYTLRSLLLLPRVEEGMEPDTRDDSGYDPEQNRKEKSNVTQSRSTPWKSRR